MQTRQNASSESLKTIRQAITNIAQDSVQLDLGLNDSANQASSSSIVNTNNSYLSSSLQENSGAKTKYFINSSINPSGN
jgi:phage terminase large subunit